MATGCNIEIINFEPRHAAAFEALNREWLERYFHVEDIDRLVLGDPQGQIIARAGAILLARDGDDIVGSVALLHHGGGAIELTKMAVTPVRQGSGIGRALLCAAIERFEETDAEMLYLETHSSLATAIRLYEAAGFVHEDREAASEYARADVYTVFRPGRNRLKNKEKRPHGGQPAADRHKSAE